jgi:DNA polymerase (family 10)
MKNRELANLFYKISELLSLKGENLFRIRAYEKAAQIIESLPQAIEEITDKNDLLKIPGIGESIAEKIIEYNSTGSIVYLEELKKEFPEGLLEIMSIPGVGPKKAKIIFDKLKISDINELRKSAQEGLLNDLPGFGEKTAKNILQGIELKEKSTGRILLFDAIKTADEIIEQLQKCNEIQKISPAGSLRRKKETIGDIDILCTVKKGKEKYIMELFTKLPVVDKIIALGETKSSIITKENIQVDLRVVNNMQYGAALQYFTGSKQHNIKLRELANKMNLTINEYGIFKKDKKNVPIASKTEEEIYNTLGLQYIPPELREDIGELELAAKNSLPKLVERKDIKGDTHVHSKYSDGSNKIEEILDKAIELNLEWVIICDHSQSLKIARGVSVKDMYKKIDEIRKINSKNNKVKIICGAEIDILSDGTLDYDDELLKEIDYVIAAIHTGFKQTEEQITERVLRAFQNKYVHAFAHPTGRLLGKRNPYQININKILETAKKYNIMLEINAFPERLDLPDIYCKKAKEIGVSMVIGTDAHSTEQMEYIDLGVYVARRGWLEKKNLLNTLSYDELIKVIKSRR